MKTGILGDWYQVLFVWRITGKAKIKEENQTLANFKLIGKRQRALRH
jgi:hypothetical protein